MCRSYKKLKWPLMVIISASLVSPGIPSDSREMRLDARHSFAQNPAGPTDRDSVAGHRVLVAYKRVKSKRLGSELFCPQVLFEDREGRYWASPLMDLYLFDEKSGEWIDQAQSADPTDFDQIGETSGGVVWGWGFISSRSRGIQCIARADAQVKPEICNPPFEEPIRQAFPGNKGTAWAVLSSGIAYFDGEHWGTQVRFPDEY